MVPSNPEDVGGLTHSQRSEPQADLPQVLVRRYCRLDCSAAVPNFKYTSPPRTLSRQVFFKFLLECCQMIKNVMELFQNCMMLPEEWLHDKAVTSFILK